MSVFQRVPLIKKANDKEIISFAHYKSHVTRTVIEPGALPMIQRHAPADTTVTSDHTRS
jgi:hypothetical protein